MKYFLLLFILLFYYSCQFPTYGSFKLYEKDGKLMGVLPLVDGKVLYHERINTEALPKEEVFRRARRWCVFAYRSAEDFCDIIVRDIDYYSAAHISTSPYIASTPERHTGIEQFNYGTEKSILELFHGIDNDITTTIKSLHSFIQNPKP